MGRHVSANSAADSVSGVSDMEMQIDLKFLEKFVDVIAYYGRRRYPLLRLHPTHLCRVLLLLHPRRSTT